MSFGVCRGNYSGISKGTETMAKPKKTWTEKLNENKPHQVKPVPTDSMTSD